MFEIEEGVHIVDLCLYFEDYNTLVIGDAHLGYEESLARKGVLIPKFQFPEIMAGIKNTLNKTNPEKIIVVGDLKHEFGTITREEWRDTLKFIELLQEYGEVILIKGNHDTILDPIARKKNIELVDYYVLDDYYFCHGHKIPEDMGFQTSENIVMGHEHPAIGLQDGSRVEVYKCFLTGPYKDKKVIVLPSLSSLPEGSDVLREKILSPFLKKLDDFEVYIAGKKVMYFGKIGGLKSRNQ